MDDLNLKAEKNTETLKKTNEHLNERVSKSCFNCWIWLMIMFILIIFVMMVLFMKLFPKSKYSNDFQENNLKKTDTFTHFLANKTILVDNQSLYTIEL